jgi:lysozyme
VFNGLDPPRGFPLPKPLLRILSGVLSIALALLVVGCTPLGETGPLSGRYTKTIWGPDVASFQHPNGAGIDWRGLRASGARFAFVKLSEGATYVNPYGAADYRNARAAGLYVGAYHFARPRLPLTTAVTDARRFAAQVGNVRQAGYLPPVLDIEATGGLSAASVTSWTRSFLTTLSAATGRTPMIYTGGWFWRGYMGNPTGFSGYPLWAAQYTQSASSPDLFGDWTYSTFWQYTASARAVGINGAVDSSWFHGSRSQLDSLAFVAGASAASPAPSSASAQTSPPAGLSTGSDGTTGGRMAQDPHVLGGGAPSSR